MKILITTALVTLFLSSSITLFAQEGYELTEVRFSGNQTFSSGTLLGKMAVDKVSWFRKNILREKPFLYSEDLIQRDLKRLEWFYQREGFLNVEVALSDRNVDHENRKIAITITIDEGQPIVVGEVVWQMSREDQETAGEAIAKEWNSLQLLAGKRFREESLEADKVRLLNTLENAGYPSVRVSAVLNLRLAAEQVDIHWRIESGSRSLFGKISLAGNIRATDSLILKQLEFAEGDIYRKSLLDKTQRRILSLGLFNAVNVKAIISDSLHNRIPVEIFVREAPRLTTRFGAGYGSEDRFRGFLNLQRLGLLRPTQHASILLKYSDLEPYNVNLNITRVQFLTPRTSISLNPFIRKEAEPSYTARRLGFNVPLAHQFSRTLNSSIAYFYERVDQEGEREQSDIYSEEETLYNKSGLTLSGIFDNSLPLFNPVQGVFVLTNFKFDGLSTIADFPYYKILFDVRRYQKIPEGVLALRIKLGGILPQNTADFIPPEERLYCGGSKSVRGWGRAELGPVGSDGDPLGGNSLLEGSAEIRFPVKGPFAGAVFSDFGNVWEENFTYHLNQLKYSIGVGVRFNTPIGPVRLDLAQPLTEGKSAKFHLDVGQAF